MPHVVVLPPISKTCESVILVEWLNREDGAIRAGDALVNIETGKATAELNSPVDGVLVWQAFAPRCRVKVGETIAVIALPGENASTVRENAEREFPLRSTRDFAPTPKPSFFARLLGLRS